MYGVNEPLNYCKADPHAKQKVIRSLNPFCGNPWKHCQDAQGRQGDMEVQLLFENHWHPRCLHLKLIWLSGGGAAIFEDGGVGGGGGAVHGVDIRRYCGYLCPEVGANTWVRQQLLDDYPKCFIVGADNVGSKQMQQIRMSLRGKAVVLMGKNTMMRKAIRGHLENNSALEK
ncbi:hypothetical protein AB205_0071820 [Aquarana catesbeiana]|uniref:Large ribosomal subunit protein uL10 n=1 Tax=Aquarana catesbeiana TaxID=8400 RepID=A0A2G9RJP3_AQUCT|nr:hypothetical protein AB205_0071820 [Aquarana catesbeiana]